MSRLISTDPQVDGATMEQIIVVNMGQLKEWIKEVQSMEKKSIRSHLSRHCCGELGFATLQEGIWECSRCRRQYSKEQMETARFLDDPKRHGEKVED